MSTMTTMSECRLPAISRTHIARPRKIARRRRRRLSWPSSSVPGEVAVTDPDDVDREPADDDYEQPEDSLPLEAEPSDAMEQHREVPQDDDDYR